ncbi:MAG: proton-conducting membrane transporter [Mesorhizobium sp.]|uniref:NADH dehydrogenase n=1 Tax=unclassified Mesorhizobium TaxID=325217 RepID=UPI0008008EFE|nr:MULTISPECIES: NADH dehydrogenase [unclassified Mesorhizobium]WIE93525.1 proton-conducting membrane transporter [Mesorhizobium sp. WSM4875]MDG4850950.1 proton-conducting membrane transporter [Mesorhizobium sp. WSM4982]MDG4901701.1 proton-conducting membrane transporter [Mesorhizobium sp. WSM4962]MDG4907436.1 proton-conducting membrane transporter [Mesorhizobium sp. WSM4898]MDG4912228.1 proton-conducting membrane transporter [Mesorhizobium sp. WSM4983]
MSTFFYMLLAFVVGVLVGWFIWGRLRGELDSLRGELGRAKSERDRFSADTYRLSGELDACGRSRADLERKLREAPTSSAKAGTDKASAPAPAALMSTPTPARSSSARPSAAKSASTKSAAAKPAAAKTAAAAPKKAPAPKKAAAPKATTGKADNLRRLIGIGPVNEKLLKAQGVTSYAQIAAWTDADVKRVEEVLNFDGRIAREKWIEQAKLLAAGDEAEFASRFPTAATSNNN